MAERSEKQRAASMRNLAIGEQRQFNENASFGFWVGVVAVVTGMFLGLLIGWVVSYFI